MYVTHLLCSLLFSPSICVYSHTIPLWVEAFFFLIVDSQHLGQDQVHNRCSRNKCGMNELNNIGMEIKDLKSCIHALGAGNEDLSWGPDLGCMNLFLSSFFSFGLLFFPALDTIFYSPPPPGQSLTPTLLVLSRGLVPPPSLLLPLPPPDSSPFFIFRFNPGEH